MEVDGGHNFRRGIRGSRRCIKIALTSRLENPTNAEDEETAERGEQVHMRLLLCGGSS